MTNRGTIRRKASVMFIVKFFIQNEAMWGGDTMRKLPFFKWLNFLQNGIGFIF